MTFGERLKQCRKAAGLTQEELAIKIGVTTKGTVSNYENGHSQPDIDNLIKISTVLDVTIDYLVKGEEENTYSFGLRLKELRNKQNITQEDLAIVVGVDRVAITNYELNRREPDFVKLRSLAKYFNVTTDYLLGLSEKEV